MNQILQQQNSSGEPQIPGVQNKEKRLDYLSNEKDYPHLVKYLCSGEKIIIGEK